MKTFSVAVAVALVLAFICIMETSAVPFTGVQELEEPMSNDNPAAAQEEMSVESWKMPYRQKRGIKCRFAAAAAPWRLRIMLQILRTLRAASDPHDN